MPMAASGLQLRPRDDLAFCRLDGGLIFLDVRKDAYFRLSSRLERAFVACLENSECDEVDVGNLLARGILVDGCAPAVPASALAAPTRSAVEQGSIEGAPSLWDVLETIYITSAVRLQLRMRKLHRILHALAVYRQSRASPENTSNDPALESSLRRAAHAFLHARRYVPIETRCLLDALSMTRYLARRGHHVRIVFGVTEDPFAAHCWVQAGDLLLSDAIGNVETYTPIWTF
jgi:hypothetical protein